MTLFTRIQGQADFTAHDLTTTAGSDNYSMGITRIDLLNRSSLDYYTEVSDGVNPVVRSDTHTLTNPTHNPSPLRLNVADGQPVSGTTLLRATSDDTSTPASLVIGKDQVAASDLGSSLEAAPLIAAEVTQTDIFFYNSFTRTTVITGTPQQEDWSHNVLGIFDGGTYSATETVSATVPLDMVRRESQGGTVRLYLNSGTKSSATDILDEAGTVNSENADNYLASNLRLVLPDGRQLQPSTATAAVSPGTEGTVTFKDVTSEVADRSAQLKIGDSAGQYEYIELEFTLPEDAFTGRQYAWDTTKVQDGTHTISATAGDSSTEATVLVDNTPPTITPSITGQGTQGTSVLVTDGDTARGDIDIDAAFEDATSGIPGAKSPGAPSATLTSGTGESAETEQITLPYSTSSASLPAGTHTVTFTVTDLAGNTATESVTFTTPQEAPSLTSGTGTDGTDPTLSVTATDASNDALDVTFLRGESYTPADTEHVSSTGGETMVTGPGEAAGTPLTQDDLTAASSADSASATTSATAGGFPYQRFEVKVPDHIATDSGASTTLRWSGTVTPDTDVLALVLSVSTGTWKEVARTHADTEGKASLTQNVPNADHVQDGAIQVVIQDEGGWAGSAGSATQASSASGLDAATGRLSASAVALQDPITTTDAPITQTDADRSSYDFTFAWESDTQYYNADYAGNGVAYEHQKDIHDWLLANREAMDIRYMFHTGDVVDNADQPQQWVNADSTYKELDDAHFPYGVLAGNHDVDHKTEDYTNFSKWFGAHRYSDNPWYGGTYKDNRGHFDLVSAGGVDFLMVYMGWGPGDEEIAWLNQVLKQYPDRVAILSFHEYLLASGGLGLIPQEILDQVVKENSNVKMVLSGHYHSAQKTVSKFDDNGDGVADRQVVNLLFDYQAMDEGGMGYLRLLHVNTAEGTMRVRTYSPSLHQYGSQGVASSSFTPADEEFTIDLSALGVPTRDATQREKTLSTDAVSFDLLSSQVIGKVEAVPSGTAAQVVWKDAPEGRQGWYAVIENHFGGRRVTPVTYVTALKDGGAGTDPGTDPGTG
ncbi:MAG: metallophosphoesterase, partial [Actinomyces sp.]|nr:metallophosphoesterase [Actinomyces sp.]